nr:reverse transcriptase domain-containing protein [Tanacetum cinerariifolium]
GNQPPAYQAHVPQAPNVTHTDFVRYIKANDAILRNMQSQGQSTQNQCQNIQNQYQNLQNQMVTMMDMMSKIMIANTASTSGSGTLPVWKALSLPELTPTCMTLELADRSVSKPIGIAKDVSFKVEVFYFPADFVVVDFEPDPREVLGFADITTSGSLTPDDDPIVSTTSPTLTPFRDSDFLLFEEADAFLGLEDDPDSPKINPFYYDPERDILLLEAILNSEPLPPLSNHEQYLPSYKKELKAFRTLKDKLTEALILIAPNWDQPFELMCDASDYAVRAVLGQRTEKHFQPIHYTSKTINQAEANYTTTEKEMLAVVYAFEKFHSYLIMNKSIVYTVHSALKYLFANKDAKACLLR